MSGRKNDTEKNRLELIHPLFLEAVGEIMTHGAKKYAAWNWAKGLEYSRCYGALLRHLNAWYKGESLDNETKKSHLWHAACELMFLVVFEQLRPDLDDRPIDLKKEEKKVTKITYFIPEKEIEHKENMCACGNPSCSGSWAI